MDKFYQKNKEHLSYIIHEYGIPVSSYDLPDFLLENQKKEFIDKYVLELNTLAAQNGEHYSSV